MEESIDNLVNRLGRRGLVTPTGRLYAEQVKAKLKNAQFSLENLKELEQLTEVTAIQDGSTAEFVQQTRSREQNLLSVKEKVNFYCECFWDFLRSSLDILAQLINDVQSLPLDEQSVDFKQVGNELNDRFRGFPLQRAVDNCRNSDAFETLEGYRHCSMHRRQVFIETTTHDITQEGTVGYYSGTSIKRTTYKSHLCNNPWDIEPVVDYNRPVGRYCESLIRAIERRMVTIINRIA